MAEDTVVLQPGTTSEGELSPLGQVVEPQTVPEPTKAPEPPKAPDALTEDKVKQLIAEAVKQSKELGKRELQGQQDRNKAELARVQRRAQTAEKAIEDARTRIATTDPEVAKELELAQLRADREGRLLTEQEEAAIQQQSEFHKQFHDTLNQFVKGLGIDPEDKRIDWATDAPNYLVAQQRVLDSVSIIQKANLAILQSGFEKRLKDIEAKVAAQSTEANSVETSTSPGVTSASDADFAKNFAAGTLPMTKANIDRYNRLLNT